MPQPVGCIVNSRKRIVQEHKLILFLTAQSATAIIQLDPTQLGVDAIYRSISHTCEKKRDLKFSAQYGYGILN